VNRDGRVALYILEHVVEVLVDRNRDERVPLAKVWSSGPAVRLIPHMHPASRCTDDVPQSSLMPLVQNFSKALSKSVSVAPASTDGVHTEMRYLPKRVML
jgi:hypothetical protein